MRFLIVLTIFLFVIFSSCNSREEAPCFIKKMEVTASAYNSLAYQTNANPHITAFGDSLFPGLRYIAVSRDLLDSGLIYNTKVKIKGFDSLFTVKDKMNRRYRNHIDIYMGVDVKAALKWGRKKVVIQYCIEPKDSLLNHSVSP